jgi:hypothetical protein
MVEGLSELEETVQQLVNDNEELFYSLVAYKASKKTIEEIVEHAVLTHFSVVSRKDFYGKSYKKFGQTVYNFPAEDRAIVDARKWFVSIMRYILLKNTYTLKLNYPFYSNFMEYSFRKDFTGAISPKTEEDTRNRKILLAISRIIKETCLSEGILDPAYQEAFKEI